MPSNVPLNQVLYNQLKRKFGRVVIRNPGDRMIVGPPREAYQEASIRDWGEGYAVDCPYCRGKACLTFNHYWGAKHSHFSNTRFLVKCHGGDCVRPKAVREELFERVYPYGRGVGSVTPEPKIPRRRLPRRPLDLAPVELPPHVSLASLPGDHPVRTGLEFHYFDVADVARAYGLVATEGCSTCMPPLAGPHLILPITHVHDPGIYADELPSQRLSSWIAMPTPFNLDSPGYVAMDDVAIDSHVFGIWPAWLTLEPIVIVQHPLEVFHVGRSAVAIFGDCLRYGQAVQVAHICEADRQAVIIMPRKKAAEAYRIRNNLQKQLRPRTNDVNRVKILFLPDGCRYAMDCGHDRLRELYHDTMSTPGDAPSPRYFQIRLE